MIKLNSGKKLLMEFALAHNLIKEDTLKKTVDKAEKKCLQDMTKEEIIDLVHKAKCKKLKNIDVNKLSKNELIGELVTVRCPEVLKLLMP